MRMKLENEDVSSVQGGKNPRHQNFPLKSRHIRRKEDPWPPYVKHITPEFEVILTVHRRYYVEMKCQLDATDDIYCRFYCMLNMFRAILCT